MFEKYSSVFTSVIPLKIIINTIIPMLIAKRKHQGQWQPWWQIHTKLNKMVIMKLFDVTIYFLLSMSSDIFWWLIVIIILSNVAFLLSGLLERSKDAYACLLYCHGNVSIHKAFLCAQTHSYHRHFQTSLFYRRLLLCREQDTNLKDERPKEALPSASARWQSLLHRTTDKLNPSI